MPTLLDGNVTKLAEAVATGAPVGVPGAPVPDKETLLLAGVALCATEMEPLNAPTDNGLNATDMEQLPPTAMLIPEVQLLANVTKFPVIAVTPSVNAAVPVLLKVTD